MNFFSILKAPTDNLNLLIIAYVIVAIILIIVILHTIKSKKTKKYKKEIERLDREKNELEGIPVLIELAKVETITKNEKMEEKYKEWKERFEYIKQEQITRINDMIIELDIFFDKKDYKNYSEQIANTELELYKARTAIENLVGEIKEINSSDEKYRSIVIKLKSKYRELQQKFEEDKENYEEVAEIIDLQFENIERRFQDFEDSMDKSEYTEVFHIVKAIDTMIEHMGIVVEEVPDLMLLASKLIPKKIEQITEIYEDMIAKNYPLGYLKIEYNVEEALKNINKIIDRIKVLNLEDCMFELKTMLEYIESIFKEFEIEKQSRKEYEESNDIFKTKLEKINRIVTDIYNQLDEIKNMYDLTDKDVEIIDTVNDKLQVVNDEYKKMTVKLSEKEYAYSQSLKILARSSVQLKEIEEELDISLKSLGNMYEDEVRAREQLDEIQELLKQSKVKIRSYKLPIISNNYFVELQEANEAILEIIKELEKKPIAIKILNIRVDTARDLVLKLYNTTNEMVKIAKLAENSIVYGNRYRVHDINIDTNLNNAQMLFYKGNYRKSLEISLGTLERVDPEIRRKVTELYEKNK